MIDLHHTRVSARFVHDTRVDVLRFFIQAKIPPTLKRDTARVATFIVSWQSIGTRILYVTFTAIGEFVSSNTGNA